jgi:hypothetical protein
VRPALRRAGKVSVSASFISSGLERAVRQTGLELRPISSRALAKKTTLTSTLSMQASCGLKINIVDNYLKIGTFKVFLVFLQVGHTHEHMEYR